jgi:alcohol dehydrogenase
VPSRDIPRYIALYRQGRLPVDKRLSDRIKLDDINHGFDLLHEDKAVRTVVTFD